MLPKLDTFVLLTNEGIAWRRVNTGARTSMRIMTCARETRTEFRVMISGL